MAAEERNVAPFSRSVSLIPRGTRHNPLDNQPVAHDPRVDELAAAAPHDDADYVRDVVVHLMPPLTSLPLLPCTSECGLESRCKKGNALFSHNPRNVSFRSASRACATLLMFVRCISRRRGRRIGRCTWGTAPDLVGQESPESPESPSGQGERGNGQKIINEIVSPVLWGAGLHSTPWAVLIYGLNQ